jgi:hypothetical protein
MKILSVPSGQRCSSSTQYSWISVVPPVQRFRETIVREVFHGATEPSHGRVMKYREYILETLNTSFHPDTEKTIIFFLSGSAYRRIFFLSLQRFST